MKTHRFLFFARAFFDLILFARIFIVAVFLYAATFPFDQLLNLHSLPSSLFLVDSNFANAQTTLEKTHHIVFDLDWTLVYPLEKAPSHPGPLDVMVEGKWYRVADGAGELLESLSLQPNLQLHFFSGGKKSRNLALLKKILTPSGKSAFELATKILHYDDLTDFDPKAEKFSDRWKKDLRKIDSDLDRVLLVDDIENFSIPGQEKQVLWTGKTYNFYDHFSSVPKIGREEWDPPNQQEWLRERGKLKTIREEISRRWNLEFSHSNSQPRRSPNFKAGTCDNFFARIGHNRFP